jgi:hypothetical protein
MVDSRRLSEELSRIKKLIAEDPQVKARFDLDGDGHIDGFEWEQVRQLVIKRLEREEAERAEAEEGKAGPGDGLEQETVAEQIYADDLQTAAEPTSLTEAEDLVLTQEGGLGQVLEGTMRREYLINSRAGKELGAIRQNVSDAIANLGRRPFSELVIDYRVFSDMTSVAVFRCTEGLRGTRLDVLDASGGQLGHVTWKPGLIRPSFRVVSTFDRGALDIKTPFFKPWTLEIVSDIGDTIGTISRGWSGLGGFLTGGNRMRIQVEPGRTSEHQRFCLLAAALLADLMAEDKRRRD